MLTNQQRVILEQNLFEGLEREGRMYCISGSSMKKVVEIFAKFDDYTKKTYWPHGFCRLYLKSANLDANLTDLLEIRKIDEEVGWFMGREELEKWIFAFKTVKIILNEEVKKNFS